MKKIYKRILSLGLAVGVIFSLQEGVHICAQENIQATESIFADYNDGNKGKTDTEDQITETEAEENTERTTEETENRKNTEWATRETETGKNTEQTTEETETGKNTEQATETETGEIMDDDDTEEAEESVWIMYNNTEEPEESEGQEEPELDEGFHQDGSIAINETNFPDNEFRKKIKKYDTNKDGLLADSENRKITKLEFEKKIQTEGIEYLRYLKKIVLTDGICSVMNSSSLEEIEISDAYKVDHLRVASFSGCTALKSLSIDAGIDLDAGIDFTGCQKLETLTIKEYMGAALDLSPCIALKELDIEDLYGNDISSSVKLDLSSQQNLLELTFHAEKLSDDFVLPKSVQKAEIGKISSGKLDLSGYTNLKELTVAGSLENLQLKGCTQLENLDVNQTRLKTLNLAGCSGLPELETLCQYDLKNADFSGCAGLKKLNIDGGNLKQLNLQGCSSLKELKLNAGKLTDLKLPEKIQEINFGDIGLTNLDLSSCKQIKYVSFREKAPKLKKITCVNTSLVMIDINSKLDKLKELDLSNNKELKEIALGYYGLGYYSDATAPNIEKIDASSCKNLKTFICHKVPKLKTVNLTGCSNLTELDVAYTGVGSIDISKFKKLVTYRCAGNNLTKLDVTKNKKLDTLDCQKNRLKYLDLRKSTRLTNIELNDNELTSFDISNIPGLGWYKFDNQYYTVAKGKKIDLAKLPGFNMAKIGKVTGGTRSDGGYGSVITLTDTKTNIVTYEYDVQTGWYQTFHIKFENPNNLVSIKKAKCTLKKNTYIYDGKAKKPSVTVTLKGKKLKQGTDYTVKYKNNKKSGIATVLISGKGAYIGTVTKTFKILPKQTSFIKKISGNTGEIDLSWKKADSATGYEIRYSTDSKMKKNVQKKVITQNKTITLKIKKLKNNAVYYVQIRTYKLADGKKIYSTWSKTDQIKL